MAGDGGGIAAGGLQRPAVQAAAGDFRLRDAAVRLEENLFGTALPRELGSVGLAVVKYIKAAVRLYQSAVVVPERVNRRLPAVQADIAVGYQRAAVDKAAVRPVADGIAELVALVAGIDKIVFPVQLADGGRLKKAVPLKARARGVMSAGDQHPGQLLRRDHIGLQLHDHGVLAEDRRLHAADAQLLLLRHCRDFLLCELRKDQLFFTGGRKSVIQIDASVVIRQHGGVKHHPFLHGFAAQNMGRIMHMSEKGKGSRRAVGNSDPDFRVKAETVVEIISPVRTLRDIRCPELLVVLRVAGVLIPAVADALTAPVLQILFRCGPDAVMVLTVNGAAGAVVGTVDIDAVAEEMGLAVGNMLPQGKIGIVDLFHAEFLLLFRLAEELQLGIHIF